MSRLRINNSKLMLKEVSSDWKLILDKYSTLDTGALLMSVYNDYFVKNNISDTIEVCDLMIKEEFRDERYEEFYEMLSSLYLKVKGGIKKEFDIEIYSDYLDKEMNFETSNLIVNISEKKYKLFESKALNQKQEEIILRIVPYIEKIENLIELMARNVKDTDFVYIDKLMKSNQLDYKVPLHYSNLGNILINLNKVIRLKNRTYKLINSDDFGSPRITGKYNDFFVKEDMAEFSQSLKFLVDSLEFEVKNYLEIMLYYKKAHLDSLVLGKLDEKLVGVYSSMSNNEDEIRKFLFYKDDVKDLVMKFMMHFGDSDSFYNEKSMKDQLRLIDLLEDLGYSNVSNV